MTMKLPFSSRSTKHISPQLTGTPRYEPVFEKVLPIIVRRASHFFSTVAVSALRSLILDAGSDIIRTVLLNAVK